MKISHEKKNAFIIVESDVAKTLDWVTISDGVHGKFEKFYFQF